MDFIPHRELFGVEYYSDKPKGPEFREAVLKVVIAPGVRKVLGDLGGRAGQEEAPVENNVVH